MGKETENKASSRSALGGVRVADFSHVAAGPYCAGILATMGAEVIKIESALHPDMARRRVTARGKLSFAEGGAGGLDALNQSATFDSLNLSKKSVRINLRSPEGKELARRLVDVSDVVVSSFRPGVMDRLGLGYAELVARKPDLVMAMISGMGQEGPESQYATYASIFAALGGASYLTGYADGLPTEIRATMDLTVGTTTAFSVLAALCHRQQTGEGQLIDISAQEAIAVMLGDALLDYEMNGRVQERRGNGDAELAPHGCYRTLEEQTWIAIAVQTDEEWQALCRVMGEPAWCFEEQFATQLRRWHAQAQLDEHMRVWTVQYPVEELTRRLQAAKVPAMPVMSNKQAFADPHLRERGVWVKLEHPQLGGVHQIGLPWKLSLTPPTYAPSPLIGEHEDEVFGSLLGISESEISTLRESKIIA